LGIEAVCQDGRGFEWRGNQREFHLYQPSEKTAEDDDEDEDEKESGMTLKPRISSLRLLSLLGKKSQNGNSKYSLKVAAK
jgi:hypothetical protein